MKNAGGRYYIYSLPATQATYCAAVPTTPLYSIHETLPSDLPNALSRMHPVSNAHIAVFMASLSLATCTR